MNWDKDYSYWVQNPQHKGIFSDIYRKDTTRDKKRSSAFMWGIAFLFNIESEIIDWRYKDRFDLVKRNIWKEYVKEFEKDIDKVKDRMISLDGGDTPGMRQLKEWGRIMDEKTEFLSGIKYDASTYDMIEKMLASNGKLYSEYERIMVIVTKEQIIGDKTRGGSEESLLEKGELK